MHTEASTTRKKVNKMAKYAEFCAYGRNTISDGDVLARFDDEEQRAEFIERISARPGYGSGEWVPVTVREIAHAYDVSKFANDPMGDTCHELSGERQANGHAVHYITHRPNYTF